MKTWQEHIEIAEEALEKSASVKDMRSASEEVHRAVTHLKIADFLRRDDPQSVVNITVSGIIDEAAADRMRAIIAEHDDRLIRACVVR